MPFCPECREEFRAEFSICQECNALLIERLEIDEIGIREPEELEIICSLTEENLGYIIRGSLESEGIPCFLENATFHSYPIPGSTAFTNVRLWTSKTNVVHARQIIQERESCVICLSCKHVSEQKESFCFFCGKSLVSPSE